MGTVLLILAVHGNWHLASAAWLFPVFLLRYAGLRPACHGLLRVGYALGLAQLVWLVSTGMAFVPSVLALFTVLAVVQVLPFAADRLVAARSGSVGSTLVFPVVLVCGEYLFTQLAGFGDYGVLGFTQHGFLPLVQLASVTGVYGVSFVVAWTASVVHWAWRRGFRWREIRRGALVWAGVLALVRADPRRAGAALAPVADDLDWAGFESLHAQRAVFRSVEYGYAMVRQSVHGVATAVDHQGRTRGMADYFTADRQTLVAEVPVQPRTDTLYSRTGDLFALLCGGGTLLVVALGVRGRRARAGASGAAGDLP